MKKIFAIAVALLLSVCAMAEEDRYYDIVDAGGGAYFANVLGDERQYGTDDGFGGTYVEPKLVYVGADGAEREIGYGTVQEILEDCVVVCFSAEAYVNEYRIIGFDGEARGDALRSVSAFGSGEYAIAQSDAGGYGLIDRSGEFVVEPDYVYISRSESFDYAGYDRAPYFCEQESGGVVAIDCGDLREIGRYEDVDQYLWAQYINPSLFMIENWSVRSYCSMETGEELFRMEISEGEHDFSGEAEYQSVMVDGGYQLITGLPGRVVITTGNTPDTTAYLADNHGQRRSGDFQRLTPLVWNGDGGVFLFEVFDPAEYGHLEDGFWEEYDPLELYGAGYRCGLVDQDGNILAEAEYTAVTVLSPTQFELTYQGENTALDLEE